jgi:hypothetical protein
MSDMHGSDRRAANIERLREIESLVPNHGISVDTFQFIYPSECYILFLESRPVWLHLDITDITDSAKGQKHVDMTIFQVCSSYT